MKRFELVMKIITVVCFAGAVIYGIVIGDFVTVAKCTFGVFVCFFAICDNGF